MHTSSVSAQCPNKLEKKKGKHGHALANVRTMHKQVPWPKVQLMNKEISPKTKIYLHSIECTSNGIVERKSKLFNILGSK